MKPDIDKPHGVGWGEEYEIATEKVLRVSVSSTVWKRIELGIAITTVTYLMA